MSDSTTGSGHMPHHYDEEFDSSYEGGSSDSDSDSDDSQQHIHRRRRTERATRTPVSVGPQATTGDIASWDAEIQRLTDTLSAMKDAAEAKEQEDQIHAFELAQLEKDR